MKKVTMPMVKEFLKRKLATDSAWSLRGLERIFENQTADEKRAQETRYFNNIGFTGSDAPFLSSLAVQYDAKGYLSPKQLALLQQRIPKYWHQLWTISDQEALKSMIERSGI